MSLNIPSYSDLALEQLDIVNLPTDRDWVIQGGPGTGKTVMAIFRAQQTAENGRTLILVYNRPLKLFLRKAVEGLNCEVQTYHEWLDAIYYECFEKKAPRASKKYKHDYVQIEQDFKEVGIIYDHIIIDEAQDFPIELVRIAKSVSKHITCFIDPNQKIGEKKTDTVQLVKTICVEAPYVLTKNFRNTKQIRDVSALFCQDGVPAHSFISGSKPTMVHCTSRSSWEKYILEFCRKNKNSSIGIIFDAKTFDLYWNYKYFRDRIEEIMPVQLYINGKGNLNFLKNGVKMLTFGTVKGLEFDHVIISEINKLYTPKDISRYLSKVYVAASRTRNELKILYSGEEGEAFKRIQLSRELFDWEEYE